jgi:phosphate transport system substrate-binding protein
VNRRTLLLGTGAALGAGLFDARGAMAQVPTVTGAGATFPRPLYERWSALARDAGAVQLNYQSIGSGGGINQITARTVDFGASDAPLTTEQLTERNLLQFPTVMGSVVLSANLPGVADNALKLTPEVIADIFLGKITRWRDNRIVELNRGLTIPNLPLSIAYRADGSGTTWVWTTYLSRVSEEWKNGPGAGTSVRWPVGNGARGNEGVSNIIRNSPGTIGYIENAYAVVNRMPTTQIRNKAGNFMTPQPAAFNATAATADWNVPNFAADTIDLAGADVWPITSPTYILLPTNPAADKVAGSRNAMRFFDWAFTNGAEAATRLEYIPLPASAHAAIRAAWAARVKGPGGEALWPVA